MRMRIKIKRQIKPSKGGGKERGKKRGKSM